MPACCCQIIPCLVLQGKSLFPNVMFSAPHKPKEYQLKSMGEQFASIGETFGKMPREYLVVEVLWKHSHSINIASDI